MSELPPEFGTPGRHTPKRDAKTKARHSIAYQTAFFKRRSLHPFKFDFSDQIDEQTNQVADILNNISIGNFEQEKNNPRNSDDDLLSDDSEIDQDQENRENLNIDVKIYGNTEGNMAENIEENIGENVAETDKNTSSDTIILKKADEISQLLAEIKQTEHNQNEEIPKDDESADAESNSKSPNCKNSSKQDSAILKESLIENLPKHKPPSSLNPSSSNPSSTNQPLKPRTYTPTIFSGPSSSSYTFLSTKIYKKPNNTPRSAYRGLANNTRPVTTPGRIRFDIAESLKKKPSWKMHTGKLKPLGSYTPEARMSVERNQKMANGREGVRKEALAKFKRKTEIFDKAREEFLRTAQTNNPKTSETDTNNPELTDNHIPELKIISEPKVSEAKTP